MNDPAIEVKRVDDGGADHRVNQQVRRSREVVLDIVEEWLATVRRLAEDG
jgi:hypothetical protein